MRRAALLAAIVVLALGAVVGAAPQPYDGTNPFICELQQAGFEAVGPHPEADPYCVEFDKRRQNVSGLGIVEFFSKEPARVNAAGEKCFYFQHDHWRTAVVQDDGSTSIYEWDGSYFFDKAKGEGGAYVENFKVNGRTEDPGKVPGMPPEYAPHMGPGTGGTYFQNDGEIEARCVEKAKTEPVYAAAAAGAGGSGGARGLATSDDCRAPAVTSPALGPVAIGDPEGRVREKLGRPAEIRRGFLRYCDDGAYLVGQRPDRSGDLGGDDAEPTIMIVARRGTFRHGPGTHAKPIRRLRKAGSIAATRVWHGRRRPLVYGTRAGRVRWVAVYDPKVVRSRRALRDLLRRALTG
ncbi:MAG TPA: hypothetical protein VGW10_08565 [Solirubrobacteraceae bacterium]|nr:hypothetical protein [Solirubrobacteraceae bacterium]